MKFNQYMQKNASAEKISESSEGWKPLNEEGIGDAFLTFFQSMKSYAILQSKWANLYQEMKDLEVEKAVGSAKFDLQSAEIQSEQAEKKELLLKAQKEKLPREKRAEFDAKSKIELDKFKSTMKAKLSNKKTAYEAQMDAKISEIRTDLSELESKNTIDSEILKKQWDAEKTQARLDINAKSDDTKVDKLAVVGGSEYSEERIARMKQRNKERAAEERRIGEEKINNLKKEAEDKQKELDDKLANASDDQKEAIGKIKQFQGDLQNYIAKAKAYKAAANENLNIDAYFKSAVFEEETETSDNSAATKREALEAQKKVQASLDSVTTTVVKKGLDLDPEDADEFLANLRAQLQDAKDGLKVSDTEKVEIDMDVDDDKSGKTDTAEEPAKEPAKEPAEEPADKEEKKRQLNRKIELAQRQLDKATSDEKKQKYQDMIDKAKNDIADLGESVKDYDAKLTIIEKTLDEIINALSETNSPAKKIMSFANFMSSHK